MTTPAIRIEKADRGFVLHGFGEPRALSRDEFAQFCRAGAKYSHLIDPKADSGPPYVVHVTIPYQDFGDGDQDTEAFNTAICFGDRETAELFIPAVRAEIEAMGFTADEGFYGQHEVDVEIDDCPESRFLPEHLEDLMDDVADGLVQFRNEIVRISSHEPGEDWFESFGLNSFALSYPEGREIFRRNKGREGFVDA